MVAPPSSASPVSLSMFFAPNEDGRPTLCTSCRQPLPNRRPRFLTGPGRAACAGQGHRLPFSSPFMYNVNVTTLFQRDPCCSCPAHARAIAALAPPEATRRQPPLVARPQRRQSPDCRIMAVAVQWIPTTALHRPTLPSRAPPPTFLTLCRSLRKSLKECDG